MGNQYQPDVWVVFKIKRKKVYKVLAGWYGGYAGTNSWRVNSGITKVEENENNYIFHGSTGSIYICPKHSERMSMLTASIWQQLKDKALLVPSRKLSKVFK